MPSHRADLLRASLARSHLTRLVAAAVLSTAACGEETSQTNARDKATAPAPGHANPMWLDVAAETAPADWLVRRKAPEKPLDTRAAADVGALLQRASARFGDSPRMVANRAAQLEDMLAATGIAEGAADLIDTLTLAAGGPKPTGGFAQICQYYFNLRQQGLDRRQALDALHKRYGSGA